MMKAEPPEWEMSLLTVNIWNALNLSYFCCGSLHHRCYYYIMQ